MDINNIKNNHYQSRKPLAKQNLPRQNQPYGQNREMTNQLSRVNDSDYPAHWEINKYGKPFRCRKCGIIGHRTESCRGNSQVSCHNCGKIGHMKFVCQELSKN